MHYENLLEDLKRKCYKVQQVLSLKVVVILFKYKIILQLIHSVLYHNILDIKAKRLIEASQLPLTMTLLHVGDITIPVIHSRMYLTMCKRKVHACGLVDKSPNCVPQGKIITDKW